MTHNSNQQLCSEDGRQETPLERLDRNLEEMTGELRVVVTGVQVLFAFLLIVPFDSGFTGIGPYERTIYFATLLFAALSAVCMLAPAAHHRFLFRQDDKRHLVFLANRVVIAGLVFLALAMCGSLMLVATKLFGESAGVITGVCAAAVFISVWFIPALLRRAQLGRSAREGSRDGTRSASRGGEPGVTAISVRYDATVGAEDHLRVDIRREQDRVVLRLTGELDLAGAPVFERALEKEETSAAKTVVLDLDGLEFVDSTGLRVILMAHERARERGQEFAITQGSPQVQRLLSITSVSDHLRVIASPDELLV